MLKKSLTILSLLVACAPAFATNGMEILTSDQYSKAFKRATVLGRANGAARVCRAPESDVDKWQAAVDVHLSALSRDAGDLSDSRTRYGIETMKARNSIEAGNIDCGTALSFWREQYNGIKPRKAKK